MVVEFDIGLQLTEPLLTFGLPVLGGARGGKLFDCAELRPMKFGAVANWIKGTFQYNIGLKKQKSMTQFF